MIFIFSVVLLWFCGRLGAVSGSGFDVVLFGVLRGSLKGGGLRVVVGWPWSGLGVGFGGLGVVLGWVVVLKWSRHVVSGWSWGGEGVVWAWSGGGVGNVWVWSWGGLGVVCGGRGVVNHCLRPPQDHAETTAKPQQNQLNSENHLRM
jgi:hypothetical protein